VTPDVLQTFKVIVKGQGHSVMGGASFFCLGDSVGTTEGHRGQKNKAGASLSEVNPPQKTPNT